MRPSLVILVLLVASGCPKPPAPPPPTKIATTYRILAGVSMGGMGAAALGMAHPERFDGVATLGGPLDAAYFQHMMDGALLSGFCTREQIEAQLAIDPARLNDPAVMSQCARIPTPAKWEHPNQFNHWHVTNNGGTFDRDTYNKMMEDLSLAFGSFFYQNPDSPFAPPGVPAEALRHPAADFCQNPIRVHGLKNLEFNPNGTYDSITFCDGEPTVYICSGTKELVDFCSDPANVVTPLALSQEANFATAYCAAKGGTEILNRSSDTLLWLQLSGAHDPCREAIRPATTMLAVDFNGNGRRDYGEPVVNNGHERFDDVGVDGCADAYEDGSGGCRTTANPGAVDPNHDNYDPDTQPTGTEGNWIYDQGEPFRDDGLDGVPGSGDYGEGNGVFDMTQGRQKLFAYDLRTNFKKLDAQGRARINVLGDGGIRDIFNLGLMAMHMFSGIKALRTTPTGSYRDFIDIPGMKDSRTGYFKPWNHAWPLVPRDVLMLYGNDPPSDVDLATGEGDHVGTPAETVNRFSVMFNWSAATWPTLARPATPLGGSTASERERVEWYDSTALGAKWEYAVALPPGYDDPANVDARYPVVYLMHGYGMNPQNFMGTALISDTFATDPDIKFRPMIYVFPNGRCCYLNKVSGARDCRSTDDQGVDFDSLPDWERECNSGTFWVNRSGYTPSDAVKYGDAFFELMDHIDAKFRTVPAAEVEKR